MLTDRRQLVLSALIEEYVSRVLPVGSQTLTQRYDLGVSAATIRNDLAILEEIGYIVQPHTSAGRIPTDSGYRVFVDNLIEGQVKTGSKISKEAIADVTSKASELDVLIKKTASALTDLTKCMSVVLRPALGGMQIKQITLVSLSSNTVLLVIIDSDGKVVDKHLQFSEYVSPNSLAVVQNAINELLAKKPLDVTNVLDEVGGLDVLQSPLAMLIIDEIAKCAGATSSIKPYKGGVSALMAQPEFGLSTDLLPIIQTIEDDEVLLHIFDDVACGSDPVVRIGAENEQEQLGGVSVVAAQFGRGRASGVVAVLGPKRMDYSTVISAVRAAQYALDDKGEN